jgi:hypothetical protein
MFSIILAVPTWIIIAPLTIAYQFINDRVVRRGKAYAVMRGILWAAIIAFGSWIGLYVIVTIVETSMGYSDSSFYELWARECLDKAQ